MKYYASEAGTSVYGIDPNRKMEKYAQAAAEAAGLPPSNFKFLHAVCTFNQTQYVNIILLLKVTGISGEYTERLNRNCFVVKLSSHMLTCTHKRPSRIKSFFYGFPYEVFLHFSQCST